MSDKAEDVIKSMDPNWRICRLRGKPAYPDTTACGRWFDVRDHPWGGESHWEDGPSTCPECFENNGRTSRAYNIHRGTPTAVMMKTGEHMALADFSIKYYDE